MKRRWMVAAWLALGWPGPGARRRGRASRTRRRAGSRCSTARPSSGWTVVPLAGKTSNWEVKDGVIEGSGGQSMLFSPRGDYKNFKLPRRGEDQRQGELRACTSGPPRRPPSCKGYEIQVNSTHADPIKTGLALHPGPPLQGRSCRPTPGSPRRSRSSTSTTGARWSPSSGSRSTASCSTSTSTTTGSGRTGHFAFQQHDPGSKVSIRKVEVMELPRDQGAGAEGRGQGQGELIRPAGRPDRARPPARPKVDRPGPVLHPLPGLGIDPIGRVQDFRPVDELPRRVGLALPARPWPAGQALPYGETREPSQSRVAAASEASGLLTLPSRLWRAP